MSFVVLLSSATLRRKKKKKNEKNTVKEKMTAKTLNSVKRMGKFSLHSAWGERISHQIFTYLSCLAY